MAHRDVRLNKIYNCLRVWTPFLYRTPNVTTQHSRLMSTKRLAIHVLKTSQPAKYAFGTPTSIFFVVDPSTTLLWRRVITWSSRLIIAVLCKNLLLTLVKSPPHIWSGSGDAKRLCLRLISMFKLNPYPASSKKRAHASTPWWANKSSNQVSLIASGTASNALLTRQYQQFRPLLILTHWTKVLFAKALTIWIPQW